MTEINGSQKNPVAPPNDGIFLFETDLQVAVDEKIAEDGVQKNFPVVVSNNNLQEKFSVNRIICAGGI